MTKPIAADRDLWRDLAPLAATAQSVAAHLFERIGDAHSAAKAYRQAIKHTTSTAERNYLHCRLAALSGGTNTSEGQ